MENNINNSRIIYSKHGDRTQDEVSSSNFKKKKSAWGLLTETFGTVYVHNASAWQKYSHETLESVQLLVEYTG